VRRLPWFILLSLFACGETRDRDPGAPRPADPRDGGALGLDGGSLGDASGLDASGLDASGPDGALPDANSGDLGPNPDSGAPADVGFPPDSGFPADSGAPDSGVFRSCLGTCNAAADCVPISSTAITDADNYRCQAGACQYTGCNGDGECTSVFGAGWVCRTGPVGVASCARACSDVSACIIPSSPLYDQDNYSCVGGGCQWDGCNNTSECTSGLSDPRYTCQAVPGLGFSSCYLTCTSAADCVSPGAGVAFDADNYRCQAGSCQYLGCHNDSECQAQNNDPNWTCR
jgi:hypothetical protein